MGLRRVVGGGSSVEIRWDIGKCCLNWLLNIVVNIFLRSNTAKVGGEGGSTVGGPKAATSTSSSNNSGSKPQQEHKQQEKQQRAAESGATQTAQTTSQKQ